MRFQSLATFAFPFCLTPISQSQQLPGAEPTCVADGDALVSDCQEAAKGVDLTWPRGCAAVDTPRYVVATVGTCTITAWDTSRAQCLEGEKVVGAVNSILLACGRVGVGKVGGKCPFPGTNGATGVEITRA
ncbi:unnamed protein product [Tuber aestivum]|uniref:Uncharacterized protein n=1 Tax=Tuber aestivum TaxID=59557 RepID=A0A292PQE2_9PEZI|nr:unnamed protein product [Tuber aestivum]